MNKKKVMLVAMVALLATIAVALVIGSGNDKKDSVSQKPFIKPHSTEPARVPAYMADEKALANLGPTLPPERFFGKAREAYQVVREIPQTAQCAVCVQEALLAYRLQKQEGLTPAQIRERIIKEFGQR